MADKLEFDEILQRPNVKTLLERVRTLTTRPINFRHTSEWKPTATGHPPRLISPAMHPTDTSYDIYLNEVLPEQMVVHELLHIVLVEEGYPDIAFDETKAPKNAPHRQYFEGFYDDLVNKLQHPEIYRRMEEEYGQDMPPYRAHVTDGLIAQAFDPSNQFLSFPLGKQTAIVEIIDHLYLQPESRKNLHRYRSATPITYKVAISIHQEMKKIEFRTPQDALKCLNIFLDHIYECGKKIGAKLDNELWRAISWHLP